MDLLIACGTWMKEADRKVIRYIQSCEIFPNVSMICTATGLSERSVLYTLGMLRQQEGFCVSRIRLFWITLDLSNRTLVINEALKRGCEGRLNFTIAHEIAHHIIDIVCGANYSIKFRRLPHFERQGNRFSLDYDEYMANQLAAALLMPDGFVDTVFSKLFNTNRIERIHSILDKLIFKKFCAMAALFGVSKPALAIRLQKKGMLGEYIFAGYESLLDVYPDEEESVA